MPKNVKELSLLCKNNFINNIPKHIEKLFIEIFPHHNIMNINNLPFTIKEIIIRNKKYKEAIKIPFGYILTINEEYYKN